jgi:hypothetical protein
MTVELTDKEFKDTMTIPMVDVTLTAEPIVDIWEYAENLADQGVIDKYVVEQGLVELVYRNSANTFDHILLPTEDKNIFTVLVIDLNNPRIIGHHTLDLNALYGLT